MNDSTHQRHDVPITTLIVDDEELARNLVGSLVRRDPELLMVGECDDGETAVHMINECRPDLVFLDVQMPVMNGMQVAETVADCSHVPYVIFVTAYDEYAIRAFELNALDYLVKPIEKERFAQSVERAKTAIRNREMLDLTRRLMQLGRRRATQEHGADDRHELTVRSGDEVIQLTTDDVVWIEAANQYVHIHTRTRCFTVSESLGQYEKRIHDPRFFRIHRSAFANAAAVRRVNRQRNGTHLLEMDGGKSLTLARSRASLVPEILRIARREQQHG